MKKPTFYDTTQDNVLAFLRATYKKIKESLTVNQTADGLKTVKTAGEAFAFGEIGYLKSDGKVWKANATNASKYPAVVIACEAISAEATGNFLIMGTIRNDSWNLTAGGFVYLGITDGAFTQNGASLASSGYATQIMGIAHPNADTILWMPQLTYVVYA